jgi:hypothetical protein
MDHLESKIIVDEDSKANIPTGFETPIKPYDLSDKIKIVHRESDSEDYAFYRSTSVVIAAIIAAEARMFMLPLRLDKRTAYTDTDSIVVVGGTALSGMEVDPVKIGYFKKEGEVIDFVAINKKLYAFKTEEGEVVKAAGLPINTITHSQLQALLTEGKTYTSIINKLKLADNKLTLSLYTYTITLSQNNDSIMKIYDEYNQ